MILRVENEIAKAHTNSENLAALAVGTSDISDSPQLMWRPPAWVRGEGPSCIRSSLAFVGLWKSAQGRAGATKA